MTTTTPLVILPPMLPLEAMRIAQELGGYARRIRRDMSGGWSQFADLTLAASWQVDSVGQVMIARTAAQRSRALSRGATGYERALGAYYRALAILMFRAARWGRS